MKLKTWKKIYYFFHLGKKKQKLKFAIYSCSLLLTAGIITTALLLTCHKKTTKEPSIIEDIDHPETDPITGFPKVPNNPEGIIFTNNLKYVNWGLEMSDYDLYLPVYFNKNQKNEFNLDLDYLVNEESWNTDYLKYNPANFCIQMKNVDLETEVMTTVYFGYWVNNYNFDSKLTKTTFDIHIGEVFTITKNDETTIDWSSTNSIFIGKYDSSQNTKIQWSFSPIFNHIFTQRHIVEIDNHIYIKWRFTKSPLTVGYNNWSSGDFDNPMMYDPDTLVIDPFFQVPVGNFDNSGIINWFSNINIYYWNI